MSRAPMNSEALKDLVIEALEDIADYMVVASGGTGRQVKSLINNVIVKAKAQGANVVGVEGQDTGEWVLLDLTDVIVHVMQPAVREFYDLERLWSMGPNKEGKSVD